MDSASINRAGMSAALWVIMMGGLAFAVGAEVNLMQAATDGAIVAGSALAADALHGVSGMVATRTTSAVATGAIFTAVQAVRGDNSYIVNFCGAAGNDYAVDVLASSM